MSQIADKYEAPTLTVIGSVVDLTRADFCIWGKTITTDRDSIGYFFHVPVGDCPTNGS